MLFRLFGDNVQFGHLFFGGDIFDLESFKFLFECLYFFISLLYLSISLIYFSILLLYFSILLIEFPLQIFVAVLDPEYFAAMHFVHFFDDFLVQEEKLLIIDFKLQLPQLHQQRIHDLGQKHHLLFVFQTLQLGLIQPKFTVCDV